MKLKEIGIQMKVESDAIEVYKTQGPLKPTEIQPNLIQGLLQMFNNLLRLF